MNRLHRYKTPLLTTLLVTTFLVLPHLALAAGPGAVEGFFQDLLWTILVTITGTILWICAMLFDFSVNTFVIGFGNLFLGSGIGVAVDRIWFILRDFVNMFFIFGLVYIGFKLILDVDNSNTRRWLVNLIIAAILINFSLLITKTVVDFSNQLATQIAISGFGAEPITNEWGATYKTNLADNILGLMGIKDLLSLKLDSSGGGGWGYIFGTAIFFLVTAFVLAAGAFLLMIRFIALTMFMLVSPLMFVSWVLPPVSDTMQRYWKAFIGRAFFAPIYFLFLYFSLETLVGLQESLKVSSGGGKWAKTFSTAATDATSGSTLAASQTTLPYFFIMCGFMIASLMIANKLGADGAKGAMSMGNSLKNKAISYSKKGAGSATLGVAGAVGQRTVGRGAHALANNQSMQKWAAGSKVGRAALGATRGVANSSFDARQVGGLGKSMGIGEGTKGGFSSRVKERKEKDEKFMKSLDDANMEDPENKARAEEKAEDMAHDAEGVLDSVEKETADLTVEIDDLGTEIGQLTEALNEQIKNQTITTREAEKAKREILSRANRKTGMERIRDGKLDQEVLTDKVNQAGLDASLATDPKMKAELREMQQHLEAKLQRQKAEEVKLIKEAEAMFDTDDAGIRKISKATKGAAASGIKHASKIAFMKTAKKKASGKYATAGDKESLSNLQKKFGKDAADMSTKAAKSAAEKKLAEQLAEIQKNAGVGGEKKEEKKEGGDAH